MECQYAWTGGTEMETPTALPLQVLTITAIYNMHAITFACPIWHPAPLNLSQSLRHNQRNEESKRGGAVSTGHPR